MALIDCPECGHKVSDQAEACPSCGRRLSDQVSRLEAEMARIDLEWRRERKTLIMRNRWGGEIVPTTGYALLAAAGPVFMGLLLAVPFVAAL